MVVAVDAEVAREVQVPARVRPTQVRRALGVRKARAVAAADGVAVAVVADAAPDRWSWARVSVAARGEWVPRVCRW